jgi:4-diphosphocytidyl-2-C-methyl-D-erythritol kinase
MVVFPNAKINLGLNIIEKRKDGYHNIESCFYPIPFTDALEVIESETLSFTSSGIEIPGKTEDNLCLKAYELLRKNYKIPLVAIHLHKHIPIGAGLGGGSADGAFMIKLLNEKFKLSISLDEQENLAANLGSDCPFFIRNKPVYVEGTGNVFSRIDLSLKEYYLALVTPNIHVSTKAAYEGIVPQNQSTNLKKDLETSTFENFNKLLKNDFEEPVFKRYPELVKIKTQLIEQGALYASMSGSGSAIFGIFEDKPRLHIGLELKILRLN